MYQQQILLQQLLTDTVYFTDPNRKKSRSLTPKLLARNRCILLFCQGEQPPNLNWGRNKIVAQPLLHLVHFNHI